MAAKIAVAGAGIYGATAAIRLAEQGHTVSIFDPLGVMRAASGINQYRVHAGYHYPRSPTTIAEIAESSGEFLAAFAPAIVRDSRHYYAIPRIGSRTPADEYEKVMSQHGLALQPCRPEWLNFEFIGACYKVQEHVYDPEILRNLVGSRVRSLGIGFEQCAFAPAMRTGYDFVVWATYGLGISRALVNSAKVQVAEKILIELPTALCGLAVVVVDGPFTAFDPYGNSGLSLFGSAKHTNHWSTSDPDEPIPERYAAILNLPNFEAVPFTRFHEMRSDCCLAIPAAKHARYLGSRFTVRVVENSPEEDRRTLRIVQGAPGEFHIFSGKVVGAVKAARLICEAIANKG